MRRPPLLLSYALLSLLIARGAEAAPPPDATVPASFEKKTFVGTIGKLPITMTLTRRGRQLSGQYRYDQRRPTTSLFAPHEGLWFLGELDPSGSFTSKEESIDEADSSLLGKLAATLRLGPAPERSLMLEGTWSKPDGSKSLPLVAHERRPNAAEARIATVARREPARVWSRILKVVLPEVRDATTVDQIFNTEVRRFVEDKVRSWKRAVSLEEDAERLSFELTFEVRHADERIISLRFDMNQYSGGAHPSSFVFGYLFDRATGKRVKLPDLFLRGSPWRKTLSRKAASVMAPLDLRFPDCHLDVQGLWLVFAESHAVGDYGELFIPWGELRAVIDPAGPAGKFLAASDSGP